MLRSSSLTPAPRRVAAVLGALCVAAGILSPLATGTASAADQTRDGLTASTALASCWDVKQTSPAAPSGLYWLYTPALGSPQQFWCDQATDGGGWVLVGRGRQGWSFLQEGQGTTAEVSATVTGTAAFAPKLLGGAVVNALLGGANVKDLPDGVRLRRALDQAGTTWQEVRMRPSTMGAFHWALNGSYPLTSVTFDGATTTGGSTGTVAVDYGFRYVNTTKWTANTNLPGFALGASVYGSTSATSYLWSPTNGSYPEPFTQVYLRPRTRWSDQGFPSTAAGLPATSVRSLVSNVAAAQPAGVSGLANGLTTERDTEVRSMAQIGPTMFVGGNLAQVTTYATGAVTPQKYLAAFDVATGAFVPGFAPVLNGKVNAVVALPSGLLAVGGEFTTVNGVAQAGLVVLDPVTGQIAPNFTVTVQRRPTGQVLPGTVTALALKGNQLYVGGNFTHISGGGGGFAYVRRAARLDATTGRPDYTWNPDFDGTPIFVSISASGDRAYFGGFMATMNAGQNAALRFAVVSTTSPAAPVTALQAWVSSSTKIQYQQTGVEVGEKFFLGGAEHSLFMYDRSTMALLRGNITRNDNGTGGDFQTSLVDGDVVYAGCHCILSNVYGDGRVWPTPPTFDDIDSLRYLGAFDATTGRYISSFLPQIKTRAVRGPWALAMDTNGCLWVGGDLTQTKPASGGTWQSSGGFARFCRGDTQPPTVPSAVKAVADAVTGAVTVSWTGSTDNTATGLRYQVFRDDLVVWSGTSWKTTLPAVGGTSRYLVRAVDKWGNTSATSTSVTIST